MPANPNDSEDPALYAELGQLSLFAADGADPELADLEGLLLGTGHVVNREAEARVSVLVSDQWRADLLMAEFELRGVAGDITPSARHLLAVRTTFTSSLRPLALRWEPGSSSPAPARRISVATLRIWVIASGRPDEAGYLLRLAPSEPHRWDRSGAALSALGLAGTLLGPRMGGPAYRISGSRRMRRLSQIVGRAPAAADLHSWPGV